MQRAICYLGKPSASASSTSLFPNRNQDTVVTLLGWSGAKQTNVAKYAKIYENHGFQTLQFTAEMKLFQGIKYSREVSSLAECLKDILIDPQRSLAFHIFSMNGIYSFCAILLQFPQLDVMRRTRGIIFDSCPIDMLSHDPVQSFSKVLDFSVGSKVVGKNASLYEKSKYQLYKSGVLALTRLENIKLYIHHMTGGDMRKLCAHSFLSTHPHLPGQLRFVYSDADEICPSMSIEDFHKKVEKLGNRHIDVLRFKDSLHVEHYRKYPREYEKLIDGFLEALEQQPNTIRSKL